MQFNKYNLKKVSLEFVYSQMGKIITIKNLHDQSNDFAYWSTKSESERLEALELLSQQFIKFNNIPPGIQKVCKIINRKKKGTF